MMSGTEPGRIRVDTDDWLGTVTIDGATPANLLDLRMRREFCAAVVDLGADPSIRALVVRGAGDDAFCAGSELDELQRGDAQQLARLHWEISAPGRCAKPVIAAVRGDCLGTGLELALCCDFIIADAGSRFALGDIGLGAIPASGGAQRLVRTVGIVRARDMLLRGRSLSALRAADWGLITRCVSSEEWNKAVHGLGAELASLDARAVKVLKEVLNTAENAHLTAGLDMEGAAYALLRTRSPDVAP